MKKHDVAAQILRGKSRDPVKAEGSAYAPANIALCKYWGKRNDELNVPVTSSLSVSLASHGTHTQISQSATVDEIILNGKPVASRSRFAKGVVNYLNLVRPHDNFFFKVTTQNTIPTAAGLASSASGFAALVLALNDFFEWNLERKQLSIMARLGSGSACRSVYEGFVEWHAGAAADGMDSYAEPLETAWPDLRLGILTISEDEKAIGSREAMKRTRRTSPLYDSWPIKVSHDMALIKEAITAGDFDLLGKVAESNALSMHATAIAAWPPVLYWLPQSVMTMHGIWLLRDQGLRVYFTMDAGPNIKLLFMAQDLPAIHQAFPDVDVITPFPES